MKQIDKVINVSFFIVVLIMSFITIYFVLNHDKQKVKKVKEIIVKDIVYFNCVKCNYSNIQYVYVKKI